MHLLHLRSLLPLLLLAGVAGQSPLATAAAQDPILLPAFLLLQAWDLLGELVGGAAYQVTRAALLLLWLR